MRRITLQLTCFLAGLLCLAFPAYAESLLPELDYAFYIPADQIEEGRLLAQSGQRQNQSRQNQASRQPTRPPPKPPYYASLGLGKTLPGGFYRTRVITQMGRGTTGFDADGNETNLGFEINTVAQAYVLEYGLTEELSFQLLIPYVIKNQMSLDYRRFNESDAYQARVQSLNRLLIGTLIANQVCSNGPECQEFINAGNALPEGTVATLPTGEQVPIGGVPLNLVQASFGDLVRRGATPSDGETGLGDIDFGVLYVFHATRTAVYAFGGGFRMPTGSFENVPQARRGTGQGMFQGAVRFNFDFNPVPPLWLSFQHQGEFVMMDGRKKKSSLLDPNELNTADPTSPAAQAAAEASGQAVGPNSQAVSQKGLAHVGLLRMDYGLGAIARSMEPLSTELVLHYNLGAESTLDGVSQGPAPETYRYSYGLKLDGLGLERPLPAYVKLSQDRVLSGKNVPLARDFILVEFAVYFTF